ncbi:MAG: TetR/AcrR family transcriptional regulator, partial [Candidatus Binatia bacterium]
MSTTAVGASPGARTRSALLERGALLFARYGVTGVTTRQLHDAIGSRNESALHYHFGDRAGLVAEIVRLHVEAVEARRALLVDEIVLAAGTADIRSLVNALAAPMADDLQTPLGRAHLRIVAQLSHPALAYRRAFSRTRTP